MMSSSMNCKSKEISKCCVEINGLLFMNIETSVGVRVDLGGH